MTAENVFYTATMARVHAEQGNLQKAAEIYAHLLLNDPDRKEWVDALAEVRRRIEHRDARDLIPLIQQWTELRLHNRCLQHLKDLQANVRSRTSSKWS